MSAYQIDLSEELAAFAEWAVAEGRFASIEEVLQAGAKALETQQFDDAWMNYQRRSAGDPHDLTASEAAACLHSRNPERRAVLRRHFQALIDDVKHGEVRPVSSHEAMTSIRTKLGL